MDSNSNVSTQAAVAPSDSIPNNMDTMDSMLTDTTSVEMAMSAINTASLTATRLTAASFSASTFTATQVTAASFEVTSTGVTATDLKAMDVVAKNVVATTVTMMGNACTDDAAGKKSTSESKKSLVDLPPEVVDIMATNLDEEDVIALRTTCRDLSFKTANALSRIWFVELPLETSGSAGNVELLTDILRSSNFPTAANMARTLNIKGGPHQDRFPISENIYHPLGFRTQYRLITSECALSAALPNLENLSLSVYFGGALNFTAVILKASAALSPQDTKLRALHLRDCRTNGALLTEVLETHRSSLRSVHFESIALAGGSTWKEILATLGSMNLNYVYLAYLGDP